VRSKRDVIKIILAVFIFLFAIIIIQFIKKSDIGFQSGRLTKLPSFRFVDSSENSISNKYFKGKNLYIQFVNPLDKDDLELLKDIYSQWEEIDLSILVATKDFEQLKAKVDKAGIDLKRITVLEKDYNKFKSILRASDIRTNYLFNGDGNLVFSGYNYNGYEQGIKYFLNRLIKNKYFKLSDFVIKGKNINEFPWLKCVTEIMENENKEYCLVSLFTSICNSCASGAIIRKLNNLCAQNRKSLAILSILSDKYYKKEDIIGLKTQLKIRLPVFVADETLGKKWNFLIKEYGEKDLNNLMFILDKSGMVIEVVEPNCSDCFSLFFERIESLTFNKGESE